MRTIRKILAWIVVGYLGISAVLLVTGKFYYWKALIYNYVNIDDLDIFPSRAIKAPDPQEWKISKSNNRHVLSERLKHELEAFGSVAFLVIRDDSIVHEQYWDGYGAASLSNSFSMAKSFVSALIGIAIEEGKIGGLDDPVVKYLPGFDKPENRGLTIRHVITMSSGLDWDEQYTSLTSLTTEAYYGKRLFKQMMRLKVVSQPGKRFEYMSCNTQLLGYIVRSATGRNLSAYASGKLWKPMHAVHDARWSLARKGGAEKAYCCLYSNARDFARIGKLYLDSGRWNGRQVVPEWYVLESLRPAPLLDEGKPNAIYGYHWWLDDMSGEHVFYARGILGQYVIVIPDRKIIIVRLGKERDVSPDGTLQDAPLYVEEVLKMFSAPAS